MNDREKLKELHQRLYNMEGGIKFDNNGGLFDIRLKIVRAARDQCETLMIALQDADFEIEQAFQRGIDAAREGN